MSRKYKVISADGHVEAPPTAWEKYIPARYRDRAPRRVRLENGGDAWVIEGKPMTYSGINLVGARTVPPDGSFSSVKPYESVDNPDGTPVPGAGGGKQRLREQDMDGLDAEVLYPPVFTTAFLEGVADKRAYLSMVQAYNTYLAKDCAIAPDRLIGSAVVPVSGIEDAINELKRIKELGLKSVSPHQFPNGGGSPKLEDDRFWETALKLDVRISPHRTMGAEAINRDTLAYGERSVAAFVATGLSTRGSSSSATLCMLQLMGHGVLDRFPDLRVYFAEVHTIGQLPYMLWFMDDGYRTRGQWYAQEYKLKMMPSEYTLKHFLFSAIREPLGYRQDFPWDNLMWGSDFPHSVSTFPNSAAWRKVIFDKVPEAAVQKVILANPAKFFGLDLEKEITPTPVR